MRNQYYLVTPASQLASVGFSFIYVPAQFCFWATYRSVKIRGSDITERILQVECLLNACFFILEIRRFLISRVVESIRMARFFDKKRWSFVSGTLLNAHKCLHLVRRSYVPLVAFILQTTNHYVSFPVLFSALSPHHPIPTWSITLI